MKTEVTVVATQNEASDDEDKTEKETATEIKKLDAQVRHPICFSKDCSCNLEMDLCGRDTSQESGGEGRGVKSSKVFQRDPSEEGSHYCRD